MVLEYVVNKEDMYGRFLIDHLERYLSMFNCKMIMDDECSIISLFIVRVCMLCTVCQYRYRFVCSPLLPFV